MDQGTRQNRGVTVRKFKTEQRIQIAFSYRGAECRELMPPCKITEAAKTHAAGLRAEILRKIAAGIFVYADYFKDSPRAEIYGTNPSRQTVGELLRAQRTTYRHQAANGTLSPSTLAGYEKAIKGKLLGRWDQTLLGDATPAALRDWIGGLGITAKSSRNILTPLRSVFEDALNDGLVLFNPFDRISLKKLLKQTAKASEYEVDPFDHAERDVLLRACRSDERAMLQFWLNTGLRPGELIALEWPKVDWVHTCARVDLNRVAKVDKAPKTEAGIRDVELNEPAIAALTAQKEATFLANGRVFLNPRTGEAWDTDAQLRKTFWEPLCKRAGVRYRNPYQVRHTYASAALTAGANPFWLANQLGHVDGEMVFKIYGKWIPADYKQAKFARASDAVIETAKLALVKT